MYLNASAHLICHRDFMVTAEAVETTTTWRSVGVTSSLASNRQVYTPAGKCPVTVIQIQRPEKSHVPSRCSACSFFLIFAFPASQTPGGGFWFWFSSIQFFTLQKWRQKIHFLNRCLFRHNLVYWLYLKYTFFFSKNQCKYYFCCCSFLLGKY